LDRVEQNDPQLIELFILPTKTFGATEVNRLAHILESGVNTHLRVLSASGHAIPKESLFLLGKAIAMSSSSKMNSTDTSSTNTSGLTSLAIGDNSMGPTGGIQALFNGIAEGGGSTQLEDIDLSWKGMYVSKNVYIMNLFVINSFRYCY